MNKMNEKRMPVYIKIALDVAGKIYNGNYTQGQKLKGRSTLAGEYNTSPETVRKAMSLLRDMKVVDIQQGSGIYIRSKKEAYSFLERFSNKENLDALRKQLKELMKEKREIELKINELIEKIVDHSERFKNTVSFNPIEIQITSDSHLIGKTIKEINFRNHTGCTIIGIKREEYMIMSPGPSEILEDGDILLVLGDMSYIDAIYNYMNKK